MTQRAPRSWTALTLIALFVLPAGCGNGSEPPVPRSATESQGRRAAEPVVRDSAAVYECLVAKNEQPDYTEVTAEDFWTDASDDDTHIPEPQLEGWQWSLDGFVGFYATPLDARRAETVVGRVAPRLRMTVARFGNVLRIDAGAFEPRTIGALEGCLGQYATTG